MYRRTRSCAYAQGRGFQCHGCQDCMQGWDPGLGSLVQPRQVSPTPGASLFEEAPGLLGAQRRRSHPSQRQAHPSLRGDPDPRHVHVAVQQVQFGFQRQDQAGERRHRVKRPCHPQAHQLSGRSRGSPAPRPGEPGGGGAGKELTGPAGRCRCRLSPIPSPSRGPPQSAGAVACALNP